MEDQRKKRKINFKEAIDKEQNNEIAKLKEKREQLKRDIDTLKASIHSKEEANEGNLLNEIGELKKRQRHLNFELDNLKTLIRLKEEAKRRDFKNKIDGITFDLLNLNDKTDFYLSKFKKMDKNDADVEAFLLKFLEEIDCYRDLLIDYVVDDD